MMVMMMEMWDAYSTKVIVVKYSSLLYINKQMNILAWLIVTMMLNITQDNARMPLANLAQY